MEKLKTGYNVKVAYIAFFWKMNRHHLPKEFRYIITNFYARFLISDSRNYIKVICHYE